MHLKVDIAVKVGAGAKTTLGEKSCAPQKRYATLPTL